MQSLDAVTDPHDYKYVLADKLEMKGNEDSVIDAIIKFVVHDFSNDFDELLKEIRVAIN